ncbi:MAG TPA: zinc-binding dehydrogenase [Gemmataceae bacterium]|nr:zinc-binding dehydrogenase [Gemmataceae bacterium]
MLALQCVKSIPAWLLLKALGQRFPSLATGPWALLRLRDVEPPRLPNAHWVRVRPLLSGVCGSDLASIAAEGSPFFAPLTSFPFTFGHEVVGIVEEVGPEVRAVAVGDRVVVEPALHCGVRGLEPACTACQAGQYGNCVNVTKGDVSAGVQTGYCRDTGGGWSGSLVAHEVQLHQVPDALADDAAVMVEPFSCALHGVLRALGTQYSVLSTQTILILGCGTMGLLTIAALRAVEAPCRIVALAKHPHQQELAKQLGAHEILTAGRGQYEALCQRTGATMHQPEIGQPTVLGGFDLVFDCVGSARSLDDALRFTRARGRTVLVGMPAIPKTVDWTTIWFKELNVMGVYAYGVEAFGEERVKTFELALRFLRQGRADVRPLVTHRFPLTDYKRAIQTALATGPHRSVKTIFDLR